MSFITSTLECEKCGKQMNVAFGIVGTTQIAGHPTKCPKCGSEKLKNISAGWIAKQEGGKK